MVLKKTNYLRRVRVLSLMWVVTLREISGVVAFDGLIFLAFALGSAYYAIKLRQVQWVALSVFLLFLTAKSFWYALACGCAKC